MKSVAEKGDTLFATTHGYARCSTDEDRQDINRQVRELKAAGAERIWLEFEHGDAPAKEQFQAANPGDTIITLEVPRLCRSTKQLCAIIDAIRDKHLRLIIVGSVTLDCRDGEMDPMTEAFGWADVGALLRGVYSTGWQIDRETLERIVYKDNKQRYSFNSDHTKIRANQGHSIQVDVDLRKMQPPQYLYHGTVARFLPAIQIKGIRRMNRQYVHLSPDYQTAVAVGRRHGSPVIVLRIEAGTMAQNSMAFYQSKNGVWLCEYVPPEYFCVVEES